MTGHNIKYLNKKKKEKVPPQPSITPNVMENLLASDVKTNVQGKSCIIAKNGRTNHILLNNVRSWETEGTILRISVVDNSTPILLFFPSNVQALQAEVRFANIMNGGLIL